MDKINDGGPAFPVLKTVWNTQSQKEYLDCSNGMTLRDYFAGQALMGFCANPNNNCEVYSIVKDSYIISDAMLEAREVTNE